MLATQVHGAGTAPSDLLIPKNIASIMVSTPSRNDTWHTTPKHTASSLRRPLTPIP